jgi:F0F1-type ATP synthase membrane subunit b/b'
MSNQYFTGHSDGPGPQHPAGYAPAPERPYGYGDPQDSGGETSEYRDARSRQYQQFPPQIDPRPIQPQARSVRRRPMVIMVLLASIVVGLGGYAVVSHINLGAVQTKADGLAESLTKAQGTLADKEAELKQVEQKLEASTTASAGAAAMLESATSCASNLLEAWTSYFEKNVESAQAALQAATEPCKVALGEGKSK